MLSLILSQICMKFVSFKFLWKIYIWCSQLSCCICIDLQNSSAKKEQMSKNLWFKSVLEVFFLLFKIPFEKSSKRFSTRVELSLMVSEIKVAKRDQKGPKITIIFTLNLIYVLLFFPLNFTAKILLGYGVKCVVGLAFSNIRQPMLMNNLLPELVIHWCRV